jgi:chloride channel protein, CIC family
VAQRGGVGNRAEFRVRLAAEKIEARQAGLTAYIGGVDSARFNRFVARGQEFVRRHWRRALQLRQKLNLTEETLHLVIAGGVGVLGGLVNLFFYHAIEAVKLFFLRHPGDLVEVAEMMSVWGRILIPVVGGLAAGVILHLGLRFVGRQGSTNMLEAVVAGDGKLPLRSGLVKAASSLVSIGTGASIGREGAITQVTCTLASKLGQLAHWPPYRLRLLVGCGAASGIAAAYNAPIAGAVFASLIVLGNVSMNLFAPLVFSSVIAAMVSRSFFGIAPWYVVPPFEFTSVMQLPWFVLLGLGCGAFGAVFLKMIRQMTGRFDAMPLPIYGKMALAGLAVGLLAIEFPGVWGNGYMVTNRILNNELPLLLLGGIFCAKLLATVVTVSSGAVGGVFTPTLFLGASLGALFGAVLHRLELAEGLPVSAFALVGMASVLAATTRSPFLAMIMVFEISLDYSLMPPLMLGCVVALVISNRLEKDSIYTEPLRAKGFQEAEDSSHFGVATAQRVGDVMLAPVAPVAEATMLPDLAKRFLTSANNFLPVVDGEQRLVGMVALQDLKEHLGAGQELRAVIAADVMRPPPPCVTPHQRLVDVFNLALASQQQNIPVVNTLSDRRLVGSLARSQVLDLFSESIIAGNKTLGSKPPTA